MKGVVVLVALAGCWRGGEPGTEPVPPRTEPEPGTLTTMAHLCPELAFKGLMRGMIMINGQSGAPAFDTANAEAEHAAEQAEGAARTDMLRAAELFMACADAYRSVPETDPLRGTADYNGVVCYENAMYSYAMAGALKTKGVPALERAEGADPRLAPQLRRILGALPHDCAVQR